MVTRILLGVSEGLGLPSIYHLFGQQLNSGQRSHAIVVLWSSGFLGVVAGVALTSYLDWNTMFFLFGAAGVVWSVLFALFVSIAPPLDLEASGETAYTHNKHVVNTPALFQSSSEIPWQELLTSGAVWAICLAQFADNYGTFFLTSWLPTYFAEEHGYALADMKVMIVPYLARALVAQLVYAETSRKLHLHEEDMDLSLIRRLTTLIGLLFPGLLIILFSHATSSFYAVLCITLAYAASGFCSSGYLSNPADIAPQMAGVVFGLSSTVAALPAVFAGPVTAFLVNTLDSWMVVFYWTGIVYATGAFVFFRFAKVTRLFL